MKSSKKTTPKRSIFMLAIIFLAGAAYLGYVGIHKINKPTKPQNYANYLAIADDFRARPQGGIEGGDVWLYDPETSEKIRLTTGANIRVVYDWSPDGKYIAIEIIENRPPLTASIGVVEVATGTVTKLKEYTSIKNTFWKSNDELLYQRANVPYETTLWMISVTDKTATPFIELPDELLYSPMFSSDGALIVGGDSLMESGKIYAYDIETNQTRTITPKDTLFAGFVDNKVVYRTKWTINNAIWEVDTEGNNRRKLVDVGEDEIGAIRVSEDGNVIAYGVMEIVDPVSVRTSVYAYDYETDTKIGPLVQGSSPHNVSVGGVSRNGQYILIGEGIRILDLKTGEITDNLCETPYCNGVWSSL